MGVPVEVLVFGRADWRLGKEREERVEKYVEEVLGVRVGDISVVLRVRDNDGRVDSLRMRLANARNNYNQW